MNQHDIIQAFSKLGAFMKSLCDQEATNEELVYIREVIQREKKSQWVVHRRKHL